ncbi:unnamed protein product [Amoebophrya sp. A25]|nr:unnamed protein product [Amoebophrya sp. A25]|eukprot:GSA25T00001234001.1
MAGKARGARPPRAAAAAGRNAHTADNSTSGMNNNHASSGMRLTTRAGDHASVDEAGQHSTAKSKKGNKQGVVDHHISTQHITRGTRSCEVGITTTASGSSAGGPQPLHQRLVDPLRLKRQQKKQQLQQMMVAHPKFRDVGSRILAVLECEELAEQEVLVDYKAGFLGPELEGMRRGRRFWDPESIFKSIRQRLELLPSFWRTGRSTTTANEIEVSDDDEKEQSGKQDGRGSTSSAFLHLDAFEQEACLSICTSTVGDSSSSSSTSTSTITSRGGGGPNTAVKRRSEQDTMMLMKIFSGLSILERISRLVVAPSAVQPPELKLSWKFFSRNSSSSSSTRASSSSTTTSSEPTSRTLATSFSELSCSSLDEVADVVARNLLVSTSAASSSGNGNGSSPICPTYWLRELCRQGIAKSELLGMVVLPIITKKGGSAITPGTATTPASSARPRGPPFLQEIERLRILFSNPNKPVNAATHKNTKRSSTGSEVQEPEQDNAKERKSGRGTVVAPSAKAKQVSASSKDGAKRRKMASAKEAEVDDVAQDENEEDEEQVLDDQEIQAGEHQFRCDHGVVLFDTDNAIRNGEGFSCSAVGGASSSSSSSKVKDVEKNEKSSRKTPPATPGPGSKKRGAAGSSSKEGVAASVEARNDEKNVEEDDVFAAARRIFEAANREDKQIFRIGETLEFEFTFHLRNGNPSSTTRTEQLAQSKLLQQLCETIHQSMLRTLSSALRVGLACQMATKLDDLGSKSKTTIGEVLFAASGDDKNEHRSIATGSAPTTTRTSNFKSAPQGGAQQQGSLKMKNKTTSTTATSTSSSSSSSTAQLLAQAHQSSSTAIGPPSAILDSKVACISIARDLLVDPGFFPLPTDVTLRSTNAAGFNIWTSKPQPSTSSSPWTLSSAITSEMSALKKRFNKIEHDSAATAYTGGSDVLDGCGYIWLQIEEQTRTLSSPTSAALQRISCQPASKYVSLQDFRSAVSNFGDLFLTETERKILTRLLAWESSQK